VEGSRRVALITGCSRTNAIAAAIARRLALSHDLMLTGLEAYDPEPSGADGEGIEALLTELRELGASLEFLDADLAEAPAPAGVVARAVERFGRVDALVLAHAHSRPTQLGSLEAGEIDAHLIVNVRATLLLIEAFVAAHPADAGDGRVVLFSSGQRLGPMPDELAYLASKGGLEALVLSLRDSLAQRGITINALNPGPTDTGWASGEEHEAIRLRFPSGRWGTPEDAAKVVAWLVGEDAAWVTGQILDSEGGFRR